MKNITFILLLILSGAVVAEGYSPLTTSYEQFKGHYLYASFSRAISSPSLSEAIINWEKFVEEARITDDPKELEDITQYELYRRGMSELARVYYISGRVSDADKILLQQESVAITETPSKELLGKMCKRNFPNGF